MAKIKKRKLSTKHHDHPEAKEAKDVNKPAPRKHFNTRKKRAQIMIAAQRQESSNTLGEGPSMGLTRQSNVHVVDPFISPDFVSDDDNDDFQPSANHVPKVGPVASSSSLLHKRLHSSSSPLPSSSPKPFTKKSRLSASRAPSKKKLLWEDDAVPSSSTNAKQQTQDSGFTVGVESSLSTSSRRSAFQLVRKEKAEKHLNFRPSSDLPSKSRLLQSPPQEANTRKAAIDLEPAISEDLEAEFSTASTKQLKASTTTQQLISPRGADDLLAQQLQGKQLDSTILKVPKKIKKKLVKIGEDMQPFSDISGPALLPTSMPMLPHHSIPNPMFPSSPFHMNSIPPMHSFPYMPQGPMAGYPYYPMFMPFDQPSLPYNNQLLPHKDLSHGQPLGLMNNLGPSPMSFSQDPRFMMPSPDHATGMLPPEFLYEGVSHYGAPSPLSPPYMPSHRTLVLAPHAQLSTANQAPVPHAVHRTLPSQPQSLGSITMTSTTPTPFSAPVILPKPSNSSRP